MVKNHCGFDPWVGKLPWRRTWHPTPVFLPGESHGHSSSAGYSPWSHKESDRTEHHRNQKARTLSDFPLSSQMPEQAPRAQGPAASGLRPASLSSLCSSQLPSTPAPTSGPLQPCVLCPLQGGSSSFLPQPCAPGESLQTSLSKPTPVSQRRRKDPELVLILGLRTPPSLHVRAHSPPPGRECRFPVAQGLSRCFQRIPGLLQMGTCVRKSE